MALLDATTAIAGELPLVRQAIDRRGHGGIGADLAARVEAVRNRYDIWGLGDRPAGIQTARFDSPGIREHGPISVWRPGSNVAWS